MNFGYSVGDILAISKLSWDVYNVYKDAPDDFRNISDEIKSLHIIVDSAILRTKSQDPKLTLEEREKLREILQGCTNVLKDLDGLLIKYKSLGSPQGSSSRAIDRVKWGKEDIVELRARLTSNTTLLNTFVTNCAQEKIQNAQAEMQRAMGEIQIMLRKGLQRRNSSSSLRSIASFAVSVNSKETWKQLFRDLHKVGVTADMIREKKDQIIDLFQGSNPPVVVEEVPETQSTESLIGQEGSTKTGKQKRKVFFKINWVPLNALTGPLLIAAAKSGDVDLVRLRLEAVGNIDYNGKDDFTALFWAAFKGHLEVVGLLLEKGANIEAVSSMGVTALYIAAQNGHVEVVGLLLEKGANIEAAFSTGETALVIAARNGHVEVVGLLLEKGANIEAAPSNGVTALYIAAWNGHVEVVGLLLEKDANVEAASIIGATALCIAARNGHIEVVRLLLEKSANIEAAESIGATALCIAARNGHIEVVRLLLEKGANIEAAESTGATAIYSAAWNGHVEVVGLLLEKGANIEAAPSNGVTALYIAAWNGHVEVVGLLLEKGANIEARDINARTALDNAKRMGHKGIVELLTRATH